MWLAYKKEMAGVASALKYSYRTTDLEYPAVSVLEPFTNVVGAYLSAGKYYEFGKSVNAGVSALRRYYSDVAASCPDTKWVLAGYSQGSMVVSEAVKSFRHSNVLYIALFTDPQLSLPEGKGFFPDACSGKNLSEYRVYAPVCRTNTGRLKARNPYVYGELSGKYGLWCGPNDYICGSTEVPFNNGGHTDYVKFMPQLAYILKRRIPKNPNASMFSFSKTIVEDVVVRAYLSNTEYYVKPGEELVIDASASFTNSNKDLIYYWSFDGGDFVESGSRYSILYDTESWNRRVTLRACDIDDRCDETSAPIYVTNYDLFGPEMASPTSVKGYRDGNTIKIRWEDAPYSAFYIAARINGYDLGYMSTKEPELTITDVNFDEDFSISVAWVTGKFNASDWVDIEIIDETGAVPPGDSIDYEAPNTGVGFGGFGIILAAILGIKNICRLHDRYSFSKASVRPRTTSKPRI